MSLPQVNSAWWHHSHCSNDDAIMHPCRNSTT